MSKVFEFNSNGRFTVTINDYHIRIQLKGIQNFINKGGLKGEKLIPIKSITEIEYKQPVFSTGYVQFAFSNSSKLGGTLAGDKNEIKITLLKEEWKQACEMVDLIESKLKIHQITLQRRLLI